MDYFNALMDQTLVSLESKLEQLKGMKIFLDVFDLKNLTDVNRDTLKASCLNV